MTPIECLREQDVIDAITAGRWPDRADVELRQHVADCVICRDVADVAAPLLASRSDAWIESASLPSADIVWYRAQVRARADAARLAGRPVLVMQAIGMACVIGAIAGIGSIAASWLPGLMQFFTASVANVATGLPALPQLIPVAPMLRLVLWVAMFWLLLTPVALYLAAVEE